MFFQIPLPIDWVEQYPLLPYLHMASMIMFFPSVLFGWGLIGEAMYNHGKDKQPADKNQLLAGVIAIGLGIAFIFGGLYMAALWLTSIVIMLISDLAKALYILLKQP